MENNNLIIEYLVRGENVSKEKYEKQREIKNAKRNGGAVTKKKTSAVSYTHLTLPTILLV